MFNIGDRVKTDYEQLATITQKNISTGLDSTSIPKGDPYYSIQIDGESVFSTSWQNRELTLIKESQFIDTSVDTTILDWLETK